MSLQKSFSFLLLYRIQMCSIWIKLLVNSNRMIIVCSFAFSIVVCTVMMSWRLLETNWNCMIKELCPNRYHFWWLTCLVISTKMALTSTKQNKNIQIYRRFSRNISVDRNIYTTQNYVLHWFVLRHHVRNIGLFSWFSQKHVAYKWTVIYNITLDSIYQFLHRAWRTYRWIATNS